ncbi:MAG: AMP-binding protein [Gammaproteobacteria bacterium]|nr:AMP-binding protein [Gammaproteobacteria bacterium]
MLPYATLCEALDAACGEPRVLRHVGAGGRERDLDSAVLHERALGLLHHLQRAGAGPGDHLMLVLDNNEPLVDAFWAALLGRIVPVPVAAGTTDEHQRKVFRIFESLDAPMVCTSAAVLERLCADDHGDTRGLSGALRERSVLLDRIDDLSTPGERERIAEGDIAFIQYSSGSTNAPKGVVLTHRNLLSNIDAIIAGARITRDDSLLSWMPLTHDMGLIGFHLVPIVLGIDHTIMATDLFVRRPALWLELATRYGATILCSPNFGYRHYLKAYRPERARDLDLSRVRLIFNGAEPISAELAREFTRTMAAHGLDASSMYPVYGLAEASLAVSFPPVGRALGEILVDRDALGVGAEVVVHASRGPRSTGFVGVGAPIAHCEVRITGDDHQALPAGRVGHVEIRGDNVCAAYHGGVVDDDMPFVGEGWLDTGDLGFQADGELYITGRAKDMICVHGHNYFPNDLESVAEMSEHAEPGRVAVCGTTTRRLPPIACCCSCSIAAMRHRSRRRPGRCARTWAARPVSRLPR